MNRESITPVNVIVPYLTAGVHCISFLFIFAKTLLILYTIMSFAVDVQTIFLFDRAVLAGSRGGLVRGCLVPVLRCSPFLLCPRFCFLFFVLRAAISLSIVIGKRAAKRGFASLLSLHPQRPSISILGPTTPG